MCMVWIGTDPTLIAFISDQFKELDQEGTGKLSVGDITDGESTVKKGLPEILIHEGDSI